MQLLEQKDLQMRWWEGGEKSTCHRGKEEGRRRGGTLEAAQAPEDADREQYIFPAFLPHMVRQGPTYPWLTLNSRSSHFHLPNARILSTLHRPSLCGEGSHGFGHSKQAVFHLSYIPHPPWVYAHLNLWLHCPSLP